MSERGLPVARVALLALLFMVLALVALIELKGASRTTIAVASDFLAVYWLVVAVQNSDRRGKA